MTLEMISRTEKRLVEEMERHYSKPKGFVGRNICYAITVNGIRYGSIVGGSATRFLPGREILANLRFGINNLFFHIEKQGGDYPCRNFAEKVLTIYCEQVENNWQSKYGDFPLWHEALVELPRTGECYRRSGWKEVGVTKGFTCKRVKGKGTDSWTGKRVWNTVNLRPKRVFVKPVSCFQ